MQEVPSYGSFSGPSNGRWTKKARSSTQAQVIVCSQSGLSVLLIISVLYQQRDGYINVLAQMSVIVHIFVSFRSTENQIYKYESIFAGHC